MKIHISAGNVKTGNIPSFSLPPVKTCSACACKTCALEGCYAVNDYNQYPETRAAYDENLRLALEDPDGLEKQLNTYFSAITAPRFFRIHVSGDFFCIRYAAMWYRVAAAAPHTNFLAFSKQWDVVRGAPFYQLPNFSLRLSDWPGTTIPDDLQRLYPISWMDDGARPAETFPASVLECPGSCETCGACWGLKDRDTLFYKHGSKSRKKAAASDLPGLAAHWHRVTLGTGETGTVYNLAEPLTAGKKNQLSHTRNVIFLNDHEVLILDKCRKTAAYKFPENQ